MPVDHGQEGLKLAARLIRGPIHQLRTDPQQMGIQDLAPDGAGILRQSSGVCNGEGQQTWTRG